MNAAAQQIVARLRLAPLPGEGGFFRPTRRTETASSILFLITPTDFSALHRIAQDEWWHFHAGDAAEHLQFDARGGRAARTLLGGNVLAGEQPQVFVPAGTWQGARIQVGRISDPLSDGDRLPPEKEPVEDLPYAGRSRSPHGYALLGCTVSPPWDDRGFELGRRDELARQFPAEAAIIAALTR